MHKGHLKSLIYPEASGLTIYCIFYFSVNVTREAFKQLFDVHFIPLRNYIYYRSGDKELATDIAQEAFMRLWEKQLNDEPKKLKGLLYKMAGDIFISKYRRQKVEAAFALNNKPGDVHQSPEDEMAYRELNTRYQKALNEMPPDLRVVFLMSRTEELKNREIAERLSLSIKAVEKRMTRALKYLRNILSGN